jgi:type I restriction enzyme S subunit
MKQGWEVKKLEDTCLVFEDGDWIESKDQSDEGVRLIQTGNIGNGFFKDRSEKARYISEIVFKRLKCTEIVEGDCLVSRLPDPVGRACIIPKTNQKMITAVDCTIIRFKKSIVSQWFILYTQSEDYQNQINSQISGATRQRISRKNLGQIEIPLRPISEQQRIVSILDEAFEAIAQANANAEQNLKNARELFESYLQAVFTNKRKNWSLKTLEQISSDFGRGKSKHRPRNHESLYGGDYPFIQTGDVRGCDHYITEYNQTYSSKGLSQSKLWPVGTICITIAANIAETGILTFDACFPDSVIGLVVNENIADRNFVEYLLQSFKVRLQALGKGSAQANINMGTFENELFPFPPIQEQGVIAKKLDALSAQTKKLEAIYQQKIADLDELKKSLLQKAFNGELKTTELVEA